MSNLPLKLCDRGEHAFSINRPLAVAGVQPHAVGCEGRTPLASKAYQTMAHKVTDGACEFIQAGYDQGIAEPYRSPERPLAGVHGSVTET